jgi:hypothetical protein
LQKIVGNLITYAQALKGFMGFVQSRGPFSNISPMKDINLLPHEWWDLIGVGGYTLTPIPINFGANVFHIIM